MSSQKENLLMTMGYTAPSKKAIKDAIKSAELAGGFSNLRPSERKPIDFWLNVQETSFFGSEAKVPGTNIVVGPDAYTNRKWFATLTVDSEGVVVGIK
jgi:hypothetical protein